MSDPAYLIQNIMLTALLVSIAFASPQAPRVPPSCSGTEVTVQPGDFAWTIVQSTSPGLSMDVVARANPQIPNLSALFPGDVLCIPGTAPSSPRVPPSCFGTKVTVQSGDTASAIAQKTSPGIPIDDVIKANPQIPDINTIVPGDVLCIPNLCLVPRLVKRCLGGKKVTVQPGNTTLSIIEKYSPTLKLSTVVAANPQISDLNQLCPNDQLCIPKKNSNSGH